MLGRTLIPAVSNKLLKFVLKLIYILEIDLS